MKLLTYADRRLWAAVRRRNRQLWFCRVKQREPGRSVRSIIELSGEPRHRAELCLRRIALRDSDFCSWHDDDALEPRGYPWPERVTSAVVLLVLLAGALLIGKMIYDIATHTLAAVL